jgi:hypothetical protein
MTIKKVMLNKNYFFLRHTGFTTGSTVTSIQEFIKPGESEQSSSKIRSPSDGLQNTKW